MNRIEQLPNGILHDNGLISKSLLSKGITNFHDTCKYIQNLPYGRTSNKTDWMLVITERRGTCSTKHALIARLAEELDLDVHLMLGIYPMKEANTPGVGKILHKTKFSFIPEAHCYLKYNDIRIDITGLDHSDEEPIDELLVEEEILPAQIGNYKENFHQQYIRQWANSAQFNEIWSLREACIKALSK
jgi:hypothetical protein